MKTKITYSEVKAALEAGFVSPLNSEWKKAPLNLARSLLSFRDAAKPRVAAAHIDRLIKDSGVLPRWKSKAPRTAAQQNIFIGLAVEAARNA